MTNEDLAKRDYVVALDKSGSMGEKHKTSRSRWAYGQEQMLAVARKCEEFDSDGIDVVLFSNNFKTYNNVTADKVAQIFKENEPGGGTDTAGVLKLILDAYFIRKAAGTAKPVTVIVYTDGEPNDQGAVDRVIIEATKKMDADEEIGITFLQVGDNDGARKFLQHLDDDLQSLGAKFDIVDTKNEAEMDNISITDVLMAAITD